MRDRPTLFLLLAIPAAILGYAAGLWIISILPVAADLQQTLAIFLPLFVAGLFMLPFVIPFFDRMAKRDLAAHRAETAGAEAADVADIPSTGIQPRDD